MIGHQVPVLELLPGQEAHLEPHRVRGELIKPLVSDVQVEGIGWADETQQVVCVYWVSCARYLGSQAGYCGCTLYDRVQLVLVIGGTTDTPLTPPTVIIRDSTGQGGPKLNPLPADGAATGTEFSVTCADGEQLKFPSSAAARALIAEVEAGCKAADTAYAEWSFAHAPPASGAAA
jgi:hypothetical protein